MGASSPAAEEQQGGDQCGGRGAPVVTGATSDAREEASHTAQRSARRAARERRKEAAGRVCSFLPAMGEDELPPLGYD